VLKPPSFVLAAIFALANSAAYAQAIIPADIGVTLTATPNTGLTTGQSVEITIAVTNYGPAPAPQVGVVSSTFLNQFGSFVTNPAECFLFVTVVDAVPTPYYYINWDVANVLGVPGSQPLNPGETRTCHFQMALTPAAPAAIPFSFGLSTYFTDINPGNDTGTVILQRAIEPIPALSPAMLLLLAGLMAASTGVALGRRQLS
jgi:hypothetical protein